MNFNSIALKMFRTNYKRYLLYFICNTFSIALFYCFAALFTNKSFMDKTSEISMVSSNVIAPSVFISIFLVLFVPFSHNAFQKLRRNDYGILMTLGMTEKEIFINILFENGMIALISIVTGLIAGTLVSMGFFGFIIYVVGIRNVTFGINLKAYVVTILFYGVIFILTVIISILQSFKMQIIDMIKERYKADKGGKSSRIVFCIGIVILIISIVLMPANNHIQRGNMWFISMLVCCGATYLILSNSEVILLFIEKRFKNFYIRNCLFLGDLKYRFHTTKKVTFTMIWLFVFAIFFMGLCTVTYPSMLESAVTYTPYHMVYLEIYGMNKISDYDLNKIFENGATKVTEQKSVEVLRGTLNVLSASKVNEVFNTDYHVAKGKFLMLYQYDLQDGYEHSFLSVPVVNIPCNDGDLALKSAGEDIRILFGDNNALSDFTLIVNEADYRQIKKASRNYEAGNIKMFKFAEWRKSGEILDKLKQKQYQVNSTIEPKYYKMSSRLGEYNLKKQSSVFLIFVETFVFLLFWASANIILYLKLQLEFEDEQRKFMSLYKMGIREVEFRNLANKNHGFMFLLPVLAGAVIAIFYIYFASEYYNRYYRWLSVGYCSIISVIIILLQTGFVKTYTNSFLKRILKGIL
ncbi:FtsX-like permease family protein [Ruminiclostridium papyrosolvens]|uniref:ABC3 transporter permease C-terminal domain-containing protein n=1 Tax=Ruminiclostridium papyrosolvens C7 TaxID=1330534 RepID=U4R1Z0_9FIRM|nr:ABC transporter permease [Ruminiclostridium papyrosolvens]EPR12203.1 hypothetical protein L323_08885 [Ruminiclostridium papyrosolvens C7]